MSSRIMTYNPKEVICAAGTCIIDGFADDSFITIEQNGDGITKKVGCHGEIARSVTPDKSCNVKITLLQSAEENAFFSEKYDVDQENGNGTFPLLIKDLKGGEVFRADTAWVVKKAPLTRGKETNNREWEIQTGEAVWSD